jgi:hypothetical protein
VVVEEEGNPKAKEYEHKCMQVVPQTHTPDLNGNTNVMQQTAII